MTQFSPEQARTVADGLVERLKQQPQYIEALSNDFHGELVKAGVPDDVVGEVVRGLTSPAEVGAFGFDKSLDSFSTFFDALNATTAASSMCQGCTYESAIKRCSAECGKEFR